MAKMGDEAEKYVEESAPFLWEKLSDFSALEDSGHLTVAQCALIVPSQLWTKNQRGCPEEMADHYIKLISHDIARGHLDPKHPVTRIPFSQYREMMSEGMFGEDGAEMPLATFDWLVSLDDAEKWLRSTGIPVDFDALRADRQTGKDVSTNRKKWDKEQLRYLLDESILPGRTQDDLSEKHGVSRQRIGKLLKQAKEMFSKEIKSSHQPFGSVRGMRDGKKWP